MVRLGRASTLTHLRCDFPVQLLQTLLRRPLLAALQQKLQELVLRPPARHRKWLSHSLFVVFVSF